MYVKEDMNTSEEQYQYELIECARQFGRLENYLQKLEGQIHVLEAERDFLIRKNCDYERKLSLIVNNPFYKAGIRLYHIFVRLHHKR